MPEDVRRPIKEEEEEEDDIVISECGDDDGEGFENPLVDLLVTSEGENIADGVVNALDRIAKHIDNQNKIFVKLYTVLSKMSPPQA